MSTQISSHKAQLVASVLDGSWRQSDSGRLELDTADLDQVTPLLYGSGAAALGWWRIRHSSLKDTPSGELPGPKKGEQDPVGGAEGFSREAFRGGG